VLQAYRFEHPSGEEQIDLVDGWSYLWAGLFGAFYVARKGFRRQFAKAAAINFGFLLATLGVVSFSFVLRPALLQLGLVIVSLPLVVLLQGISMIRIVRDGYRRRGWWSTLL
jgi:hypothetical protein